MPQATNLQVRLARRPDGMARDDTWAIQAEQMPALGPRQFLVRNEYISLDPAMRGWIRDAASYTLPVQVGEVMRARAVGEVVASVHPDFPVGAKVLGFLGVQQFAASDGTGIRIVDAAHGRLPLHLAVLGMPGMTAYFGLLDVGACVPGDTVVVSAASGAVGQVAVQIAKIRGCRVIGIAGGPDKCSFVVDTLKADACVDYKRADVGAELRRLCPNGIDVFFDNVGGDILDAALANLAMHARVVICGAISQYNQLSAVQGPRNYLSLLMKRATMKGMVVTDFDARNDEARRQLLAWIEQGRLVTRLDIDEGLHRFPDTFRKLFDGRNFGKQLLKVQWPEPGP